MQAGDRGNAMDRTEILSYVEDALDSGVREHVGAEDVPKRILARMIRSIERLGHPAERIEMILFGKGHKAGARLWLLTNERLVVFSGRSDPDNEIALIKIRSVEEYGKTLFVRCHHEPSPMLCAFDMRRAHKMAKLLRLTMN